jgi:hypothetical protein
MKKLAIPAGTWNLPRCQKTKHGFSKETRMILLLVLLYGFGVARVVGFSISKLNITVIS